MAVQPQNTSRNNQSGSRIAALVILVFIVGTIACYFFLSLSGKSGEAPREPETAQDTPAFTPPVTTPPPAISEPPRVVRKQADNPVKKQGDYPAPVPAPVYEPQKAKSVASAPAHEPQKARPAAGKSVRLAIIIDDMGGSLAEARLLAGIKVPLTFSIIPGLRADKEVAAYAASGKIETMIHIPMQSKGWPERRLEANGLLVSMADGELQERVSGFVRQFPGAVGANNHMGSEFTEHEEKMSPVLQVLREKKLFFVDSVTSPASKGFTVAQHLGIRTARRHVFLDNEQEQGYILGQLSQAVKQARKSGSAIAICHPHPATITALAAALPKLSSQGVELVPASQLVK
jgi:polysaccharide deacetylase 2 family uncharacterized protein YibQ